jgi:hypothetical protein
MRRSVSTVGIALYCGLALTAFGQGAWPRNSARKPAIVVDSGPIANPEDRQRVVYSTTVFSPGASWLRLTFGRVVLAGDPETETASCLLLTSFVDGATQRLNAVHLRQWANTSAYFNGDAVRIDLIAAPGAGENRVTVASLETGPRSGEGTDSICGPTDDRGLSGDGRIARILTSGNVCTGFIISDSARCMLSAGQCAPGAGSVVEFNAPMSTVGGALVHPPPSDQYAVDPSSIQSAAAGPGNDWAYFAVFANSNTGLGAASAQGSSFPLIAAPATAGQTLWLSGYGAVSAPVPPTWNQVQKSGSGTYVGLAGSTIQHQVDTTTGDSGAPVTLDGSAIGINDGDGCVDPPAGSFNTGTASQNAGLQAALAAPMGLCSRPSGPPEPPIYLATDPGGNLATVSRSSGAMGIVGATNIAGQVNGLAFDRGRGRFYASEFVNGGPDRLYIVDQLTGAATLVGDMVGPPDISGLGFDPNTDTLYGIDEGSGQLYTIDFQTAAATPVGSPADRGWAGSSTTRRCGFSTGWTTRRPVRAWSGSTPAPARAPSSVRWGRGSPTATAWRIRPTTARCTRSIRGPAPRTA